MSLARNDRNTFIPTHHGSGLAYWGIAIARHVLAGNVYCLCIAMIEATVAWSYRRVEAGR